MHPGGLCRKRMSFFKHNWSRDQQEPLAGLFTQPLPNQTENREQRTLHTCKLEEFLYSLGVYPTCCLKNLVKCWGYLNPRS